MIHERDIDQAQRLPHPRLPRFPQERSLVRAQESPQENRPVSLSENLLRRIPERKRCPFRMRMSIMGKEAISNGLG